jgi:hypothetical protein
MAASGAKTATMPADQASEIQLERYGIVIGSDNPAVGAGVYVAWSGILRSSTKPITG